ncbi:suppressor of fused domain protein [Pseudomonas syringae]|uniref:suppressor of fused domain protein n=1 Tax=Pseudomonas syringae TaxID=317 RepID=UPI001F159DD8|nr:suppressor of fused domain protein [Pseudomonas syringae]
MAGISIPFLWNDGHFEELLFADIQINWLQCFAIHETEKDFISKYGSDSFESLLTEQEINVLDMEREPVSLPYRYSRRAFAVKSQALSIAPYELLPHRARSRRQSWRPDSNGHRQ